MQAARVVIPVHNAEGTIARQLEALAGQVGETEFEVVVVLNRCSDGSEEIAESFQSALNLDVIKADRLASAAYARNVGAEGCNLPCLLFCDADDAVGPEWVHEMVLGLQSADLVGGRIDVDRTGLPDWIYRWRYESLHGRCLFLPWDPSGGSRLPYAMGASMGCTTTAFQNIGGFDESFTGAGSEEVEFSSRLLRSGCRIGEASRAGVSYAPRRSMRKVLAQLRGYAQGEAEVNAREGRISAPKSNKEIVSRLGRRAANLILRRRLLRPHEIICRVVADYYQLAATRRWWESPGATVNRRSTSEFVVPQSAPLIGGLAFTAQRASSGWYASNGVEQHSLAAVELLFRANGLFIDCGANIGVFSVAALVVGGSDARAISFEPDSRTQQILAANLDRHAVDHRVQVRPEALGGVSGSRWFYECENDTVSGFAVAPEQFSPGRHVAVQVPATRLDDAVDLTADFIKIDVEGFEAEVLSGAELLIRNGVPDLIFLVEANPASLEVAGCSISDVIEYFPENDWAIWLIDDHAKDRTMAIRRIDRARLEVFHEADPKWYGNLLVTRSSRVDRVVGLLVSAGYVNA